jgi:hypothetical protein
MVSPTRWHISIAGMSFDFRSHIETPYRFELSPFYDLFACADEEPDARVELRSQVGLPAASGRLLFESKLNWRMYEQPGGLAIETYHPPTNRTLAMATCREEASRWEILFDAPNWCWLWSHRHSTPELRGCFQMSHNVNQLLLVPRLARRGGLLVHAAGAVVNDRAFVFAGHSGDGKTTLSHLLETEGAELLSDERIALRRNGSGFTAYGTPWPGEGNVVSAAAYPLGGVFLLRKGSEHRLWDAPRSKLAAELLSRSIVPYYLAHETSLIAGLIGDLVQSVPLRILEFSRSPGVLAALSGEV